jgi:hypothetical protein
MATSHVIARVSHGKTVAFLTLKRGHVQGWSKNRAGAYRFRSSTDAAYYLSTMPDTGAVILPDKGIPTALQHPPPPRGRPTPVVRHDPPPLTPFRYSTGQRIGLTVGAVVVVLFAIALVMGW